MGFLFGSKRVEEVERSVAESFAKVKQDTDALYQWINYLYAQNQQLLEQTRIQKNLIEEQKLALHELKVTVQHLPKTAEEVRRVAETQYHPMLERLRQIENRLAHLELLKKKESLSEEKRYELPPAPKISTETSAFTKLKEKLVRKIARNSKSYIQNLILGLVHKYGKISALQLREIVVEEQGLCSKSSFYRLLEEMEKDRSLSIVSDGKNKVYIAPALHKHA